MWKTENFIVANGFTEFRNPQQANDLSPYDYFDGGLDTDIDGEFYDATGSGRRARRRVKKSRRSRTGGRLSSGVRNVRQRSTQKSAQRQAEAETQRKAIADVQKSAEADAVLLAQLSQPTASTPPTSTNNSSSKKKIAITIGVVAIVGLIAYVVYKKMKK